MVNRVAVIHNFIHSANRIKDHNALYLSFSSKRYIPRWHNEDWTNATLDMTGSIKLNPDVRFPPKFYLEGGKRLNEVETIETSVKVEEWLK